MGNLKDILLIQKRELEQFTLKDYIERNIILSELKKDIIKVIIGPRRAGKSFFTIHELKKYDSFGYVNFDDEQLIQISDYNDLIACLNEIYSNPKVLFIDEIQNLPRWELFVNRLQRQGFNLILTGSNSNLLSKELSTHLTGRHITTIVFPFSFNEYLKYFTTELTTSEIKAKLDVYLIKGGFPEPLVKEMNYTEYLKTLIDSILFKDIIKRYHIKPTRLIDELSYFLISNYGNMISFKSLTKMTSIKSPHTIEKYLTFLEETFLFFRVNAFSFKIKNQIKTNKKIYTIDNGFITAKSFKISKDFGKLYENIVAIELKRKELVSLIKFYYYKNPQGYEVDFVIYQDMKVKQLIQVCYDLSNHNTKKREIRALVHAGRELNCSNLLVITENQDNIEEFFWFNRKHKIQYIPLWKWLMAQ